MSIEFALDYNRSIDYRWREQLQLYLVLLPMGAMYFDCNHYHNAIVCYMFLPL